LEALQEAAEAALVSEFESKQYIFPLYKQVLTFVVANLVCIHGKHVTLQVRDMCLVRSMRYIISGYSWVGNMDKSGG
jgi:hypothetical protein